MKLINISLYSTEFIISMSIWDIDDEDFKYGTVGPINDVIKWNIREQIFVQELGPTNYDVETYLI